MTDEQAGELATTLWIRIQQLVPTRHQAELNRLYSCLQTVEGDRREAAYVRGIDRGIQLERLASITTTPGVGPDGEWRDGVKVQ